MAGDANILVYGPAYLDLVITIDQPLCAPHRVDKSIRVSAVIANNDNTIHLHGENGDDMLFPLADAFQQYAADYYLSESVLPGIEKIDKSYHVISCQRQLGGMGAGYALALNGLLRHPQGEDSRGDFVSMQLRQCGVVAQAEILTGESDLSLVIIGGEDKLTMGQRPMMTKWRATEEDHRFVADASALCFCGAPNALTASLLPYAQSMPIMLAPSRRNINDIDFPLAVLAGRVSYLTLNRLEWEELPEKELWRKNTPIITITDGPNGCQVILATGEEFSLPAHPHHGMADTNRCGETFGTAFFRTLVRECPQIYRCGVSESIARVAAEYALLQAWRQMGIFAFGMPEMQ